MTISCGRFTVAAVIVLSIPCSARAQEFQWEKQGTAPDMARAITRVSPDAYVGPQPFDMIHYDLDLRFAMVTPEMGGTVTMTIVTRTPLSSLTLNESALQLDSVAVNGTPVLSGVTYANEAFTVPLPSQAAAGDTLTVVIRYQRPPGLARPSDRQGYYYFVPDSAGLQGLPDTVGYTMSEPSDARFWLPCYDQPWDKATLELRATVPRGFVAASNGRLLGTSVNADGTVTWHWREDHQIATYLMAVTISKWAVISLPLVRAAGDTVPVQYYVWRPDSAQCASYLPTVVTMIENLSDLFGPYPFDKYGMTGVVPFSYGGMEHQSITTLHRAYETTESVVVHELGHQWWGDDVTCGTWADIWLNESFASYVEALWHESIAGPTALRAYMLSEFSQFGYGSWSGTIYDPVEQGFGYFPSSVYSKGAWVLHTLRGVLGGPQFFAALRAYRARFHGGAAITDEFRAVVDSVSSSDMRWFFDEWIYGKGWPQYAVAVHHLPGQVSFTVYQRQDTSWPTFRMPIQVRVAGGGQDTLLVIQDSARVQSFTQPISFQADSVILDPGNWILKQMVSAPTSVSPGEPPLPEKAMLDQNYPNPFNPTTVISGQWSVTSVVRLSVYDILGREVAVLAEGTYPAGKYSFTFDGSKFASGAYFYRLTTGAYSATKAMLLVK